MDDAQPVTTTSRLGFADTVTALSAAIAGAGSVLFATIDQAAAASAVGLALRPTTLLVFGNPRGGTPLMHAFPALAVQLPLKLVVWHDGGAVRVTRDRMARLAPSYGAPADHPAIAAMDHLLDALAAGVA